VAKSILAGAVLRIVVSIITILVVLFLFNTFTPRFDREVAAGVSVGLAIAVSSIVESKVLGTPLSARLLVLRAFFAGLVVTLVLSYLSR
jgi:hypothetical protein